MFPKLLLNLLTTGKNGDSLTAKDLQEQLTSAVIAISKHGKNYNNSYICALLLKFDYLQVIGCRL